MFDSKLKKELAAERERALKSEALDHAMHDHLPMIEFTTDGYILDASPLFLHSVGYFLNEIVQQHHGRIEVASEPGRYTRMRVCLPLDGMGQAGYGGEPHHNKEHAA